ncbi:hypothetical protein VTJ49DRAFT_2726 [Mycothermus thermophilus]|uniref:Integral membrane protein n=1 Tax=Humicola insolens TaxID=85995 RepID=A0ABR3VP14_HUMIN
MDSLTSEIQKLASPTASPLSPISTNPSPVTGKAVITDYFPYPMLISPFSSTPQTRSCMGNAPDARLRTVYFHAPAPEFPICAFCYATYVGPSAFASSFSAKQARNTRCGFHVPRVTRVLWPAACATGDLAPLIEYMRRRSSGAMPFCGDPGEKPASAGIKWFVAKDGSALPQGDFGMCEACYEDMLGGGPWRAKFEERPGAQPEGERWVCDGWNLAYLRLILKGDWERFVEHVRLRRTLPGCDGEWKAGGRWWKLRGFEGVVICESCYVDVFKDSRWEGIVEPDATVESGYGFTRACDWHYKQNPNLSSALNFTEARKLGAEELRRSLVSIASKPVCGKPQVFVDGRYYNVRGTPIPNFGVCEACYEGRIAAMGLTEFFTDRPSMVPGGTYCSFNPAVNGAGYFYTLLLEALQTGVWAVYENKVRALSTVPSCLGINSMKGGKWWGWPECTICEWHYHSVAAESRFASEMPLQGIVGAPDEARICSLFSDGQQRRYQEACESGKLDDFLAFCRERFDKWKVMWPAILHLQSVISNTYWRAVNLQMASHGHKMSDAITFGTPTTTYITGSGNRYNSHDGVLAEQEAAQAEVLFRQSVHPREEQARLLAEWAEWE